MTEQFQVKTLNKKTKKQNKESMFAEADNQI